MHRRARARRLRVVAAIGLVVGSLTQIGPAEAGHGDSTLPGSNFELDNNANLKVDHAAPAIDWASVAETRATDTASGANDNSYSGGSKEDDTCPSTTTGSIPNNKSDLLKFGAYTEVEAGGPGYLHLFWQRVQEPSGTTLIDFELNQSGAACANGVNRVRTVGDLLIEYRLEQGGATAAIKVREWSGSAWGAATDITGATARGTINTTAIPAAESDGLSTTTNPVSARTFGELSLDLDFVFDDNECESFGSAFVKSRSSDSFTSQLKDFIAPVPVNITNCGKVIIRKQTTPDENPNSTEFGYTKSFATDPATDDTFTLTDDGALTFDNVLFGTEYTVVEDVLPTGWQFASLDCGTSTRVTPSVTGATATFTIDNAADIVDCTYTNEALGTIIVEKQTDPDTAAGEFTFTGEQASGTISDDEQIVVENLEVGTYTSTETDPAPGFDLTDIDCDDGESATPSTVNVETRTATFELDPGETVTCTFTNTQRGTIVVEKQTDPDGAEGEFTFTGDAAGEVSDDGKITVNNLVPGQYTSTEADPTPGFDLASIGCDDANSTGDVASLTATFNLDPGETVTCTFTNRQRGQIDIHKEDDAGNALAGAVFTLFVDNAPLNGAAPHGAEDTATALTCTTDASGDCSIANVVPGPYWVVETSGVAGYDLAPDQYAVVGAGKTVGLTFVDPRQHKVIVIVCHQGTNTLAASGVTDGAIDLTTLAESELEAELCALEGFTGKPHGELDLTVDVGSGAH